MDAKSRAAARGLRSLRKSVKLLARRRIVRRTISLPALPALPALPKALWFRRRVTAAVRAIDARAAHCHDACGHWVGKGECKARWMPNTGDTFPSRANPIDGNVGELLRKLRRSRLHAALRPGRAVEKTRSDTFACAGVTNSFCSTTVEVLQPAKMPPRRTRPKAKKKPAQCGPFQGSRDDQAAILAWSWFAARPTASAMSERAEASAAALAASPMPRPSARTKRTSTMPKKPKITLR